LLLACDVDQSVVQADGGPESVLTIETATYAGPALDSDALFVDRLREAIEQGRSVDVYRSSRGPAGWIQFSGTGEEYLQWWEKQAAVDEHVLMSGSGWSASHDASVQIDLDDCTLEIEAETVGEFLEYDWVSVDLSGEVSRFGSSEADFQMDTIAYTPENQATATATVRNIPLADNYVWTAHSDHHAQHDTASAPQWQGLGSGDSICPDGGGNFGS
jgi:hypothetical protein